MAIFGQPAAASPWPRAILHLDMDAFYVNVHLLDCPQEAGLPLVIGGRLTESRVVASASYEAVLELKQGRVALPPHSNRVKRPP
jgi:nucleotidyltransferase/DNA polymerase involved in DNA repair